MGTTAAAIAQRQQVLLLRSSALRSRLVYEARVLRQPLALADQARDAWHWLRTHPEWPVGVAMVLVVARPGRTLRWGFRLWAGWRWWRGLQRRLVSTDP